ncbi:hypothetical protein FIBSPDRAFT_946443 [Athelia psychrophila]|uniref:Valyl-tRNA synthetase tRNA-binding arm domain-containing protein n=1 Tax=Athelia psychrophila TaxID=1759441 RepID=A0A166SXA3_9AGAM|nr:hypothetical protein FIBSPDRAFT_946443 [Fibularhizoctonia sp. CBS 109695]
MLLRQRMISTGSSVHRPTDRTEPEAVPVVFVHVLVRGLVDLDNEIAKCDKKIGLAQMTLTKLQKVISQPNYTETIPANVQEANEEKRKTLEAELTTLEASKEMFTKLK